jgi:hypothetical protein
MLVKLVSTMQETHNKEIEYLKFTEGIIKEISEIKTCSIKNCESRIIRAFHTAYKFYKCSKIEKCKICFNNHCDKHTNCGEDINIVDLLKVIVLFPYQEYYMDSIYGFVIQYNEDKSISIDNINEKSELRKLTERERKIADTIIPHIFEKIEDIIKVRMRSPLRRSRSRSPLRRSRFRSPVRRSRSRSPVRRSRSKSPLRNLKCSYVFTRGRDAGKFCEDQVVDGYKFCKQCLKRLS